jgi:hypothetical protein
VTTQTEHKFLQFLFFFSLLSLFRFFFSPLQPRSLQWTSQWTTQEAERGAWHLDSSGAPKTHALGQCHFDWIYLDVIQPV